jgi:hypothetical protein
VSGWEERLKLAERKEKKKESMDSTYLNHKKKLILFPYSLCLAKTKLESSVIHLYSSSTSLKGSRTHNRKNLHFNYLKIHLMTLFS